MNHRSRVVPLAEDTEIKIKPQNNERRALYAKVLHYNTAVTGAADVSRVSGVWGGKGRGTRHCHNCLHCVLTQATTSDCRPLTSGSASINKYETLTPAVYTGKLTRQKMLGKKESVREG